MKENFDYDYTIAVHFQSLDEMRPVTIISNNVLADK